MNAYEQGRAAAFAAMKLAQFGTPMTRPNTVMQFNPQPGLGDVLRSAGGRLQQAVAAGRLAGQQAAHGRRWELYNAALSEGAKGREAMSAAVPAALRGFHGAGGTSALAPFAGTALALYGGKKLYDAGRAGLHRMQGRYEAWRQLGQAPPEGPPVY